MKMRSFQNCVKQLVINRTKKLQVRAYLWCAVCTAFVLLLLLWTKLEVELLNRSSSVSSSVPHYEIYNDKQTKYDREGARSLTSSKAARQVTKSLSELMRNVPELNEDILLFNRIPNSGSELLVLLLQWLESFNTFKHVRLAGGHKHRLNRFEQEQMVEKVTTEMRDGAIPLTFDRHVYFVNFSSFGRQSPTYINLVRDPIDKVIARFYKYRATPAPSIVSYGTMEPSVRTRQQYSMVRQFERCVREEGPKCTYTDGKPYDLTIPYFCGHDRWCMMLNDEWALQQAKEKVERYFPVVGLLEEINKTFTVLEHRLPYFFKGAMDIFSTQYYVKKKDRTIYRPVDYLSEDVKQKLQSQLALEYELYNWLRGRLLRQYKVAFDELDL